MRPPRAIAVGIRREAQGFLKLERLPGATDRKGPGSSAWLGGKPAGAADAGSADPAVATRVLRQVLLVVVLGVVERLVGLDLGRDLAIAGLHQLVAIRPQRLLGRFGLARVGQVDRRAVLRTDVVALTHALRRVMVLPEDPQHL